MMENENLSDMPTAQTYRAHPEASWKQLWASGVTLVLQIGTGGQ